MTDAPRRAGNGRSSAFLVSASAPALAASAFAACWLILGHPAWLALKSDDFGYVRSILLTLEQGRVLTYDWLAPYGAPMTALCALAWKATGNFYLATLGFMAVCSLGACILLMRLLAIRLAPAPAAWLALALATSPVFFTKATDFHGCIPTLAFFLLALSFHEAGPGRRGLFFLAAFLAFANRQNQLVLLALPLWRLGADMFAGRGPEKRLSLWVALFAAAAFALGQSMNPTYAREHALFIGGGLAGRIGAGSAALFAGSQLFLGMLALAGMLFHSPAETLRANLRAWKLPAALTLAMAAFLPFWRADLVRTDVPLFGLFGWGEVNRVLPWLLLPMPWLARYRLLRPSPYLALAAGFLLIASLRGVWWDYYFLEPAVLAVLLAAEESGGSPVLLASSGRVLLGAALAVNLAYAYMLKVQGDRQVLSVRILERMERGGRITVNEMSNGPFGYLGWKLFDRYVAERGRDGGELADFLGYVSKDRVRVETGLPWRRAYKEGLPAGAEMLETGKARLGFVRVEYRVTDRHGQDTRGGAPGKAGDPDGALHPPQPFPLDNREWGLLLDSLERKR